MGDGYKIPVELAQELVILNEQVRTLADKVLMSQASRFCPYKECMAEQKTGSEDIGKEEDPRTEAHRLLAVVVKRVQDNKELDYTDSLITVIEMYLANNKIGGGD